MRDNKVERTINHSNGGKCVDDELLFRYLDKNTTEEETGIVKRHLAQCQICLNIVASVIRNEQEPVTEQEKAEVRKLLKLTQQEQVDKILSYVNATQPEPRTTPRFRFAAWLSNLLKPLPRYTLTLSSVIIILVASVFVYKNFIETDISSEYVFDQKVPYEYDLSTLRSAEDISAEDYLFRKFTSQFKIAMSDYVLRDYQNTIHTLEALEPVAFELQAKPGSEKYLPRIQELNFYLGVSHLAQARSRRGEFTEKEKAQHLEKSIKYLLFAKSLALDRGLVKHDKEIYFLGLTYGFAGRKGLALEQLNQIKPESEFRKESIQLIQEWSKN